MEDLEGPGVLPPRGPAGGDAAGGASGAAGTTGADTVDIDGPRLAPGRSLSHFRILSLIGEGGMGVVYRAEDQNLRRVVALKVLAPAALGDEARERRLLREARAAATVSHPAIATIYEVGTDAGIVFIAMEHVGGETLRALMARPPRVEQTLGLLRQIAEGLDCAHRAGVVHRDLKPENVLVQPDGRAKILDFGLAIFTGGDHQGAGAGEQEETATREAHLTSQGVVLGTVAYMSPEQVRGGLLDARSDLFSLGILAYEMLAGRHPFRGPTPADTMAAILSQEPQPLRDSHPELPPRLARVVERLLAKDPALRPASARELLDELAAATELAIEPASAPATATGKQAEGQRSLRSIAILPFQNLSSDPEQEYFCDGMAEELISALAQIPGLHVAARTSAFQFKGRSEDVRRIGESLNVDTVLEGSVRRSGNRLRLTAQLVSAADGYHLWSERFEREMRDVFALQDEIGAAIVEALEIALAGGAAQTRPRRPADLEAYDLYLRGRHHLYQRRPDLLPRAIECFEKAIAAEPTFALAYAGLAECYTVLAVPLASRPPAELFPKARANAEKALALDPTAGEAHASLGLVRFWFELDLRGAEAELRRAIELAPSYAIARIWLAQVLACLGRHEEAATHAARAQEVDPLSPLVHSLAGIVAYWGRDYQGALENARKALAIEPAFTLAPSGLALMALGRQKEAIDELRRIASISSKASFTLALLGWGLGVAGHREEARQLASELEARSRRELVPPTFIEWVYIGLDDHQAAFDWLERAYRQRGFLVNLAVDPAYDRIRQDPRFGDLLRRLGLGT
jgi:serine/threonine protein kinase/Flp pilus assembly protein TadD